MNAEHEMVLIGRSALFELMREAVRVELSASKLTDELTIDQAADLLTVNPATIRNWIKREGMPAKQLGHVWRINRADLESWMESRIAKRGTSPTRWTAQMKRLRSK